MRLCGKFEPVRPLWDILTDSTTKLWLVVPGPDKRLIVGLFSGTFVVARMGLFSAFGAHVCPSLTEIRSCSLLEKALNLPHTKRRYRQVGLTKIMLISVKLSACKCVF